MRIALTALTPHGPRDLIVTGADGATVGDVATAAREVLAGAGRLAPVISLPLAAPERDGPSRPCRTAAWWPWIRGPPRPRG